MSGRLKGWIMFVIMFIIFYSFVTWLQYQISPEFQPREPITNERQ